MSFFNFFKKSDKKFKFKCSCCGEMYDEVPLCFGSEFPDYFFSVPPEEREQRIELKESLCVVDKEHFFHRCRLTIPIIDHEENLIFNVWTSISEDNFGLRMDLWNDEDRINQEPYFGWLQSIIHTYDDTLNIKTIAYEQEVGLIPEIKVIEENHQLSIDQEKGITYKQALYKVDKILKHLHQKS